MRGFVITTVFMLVFAVVVFVFGWLWWGKVSASVSDNNTTQSFIIPKGVSAAVTGNQLESEGLINSALAFKVYVQVTGKADDIKAGQFTLSPDLTLVEVVEKLTKGPIGVWVTIPEGLRAEELSDIYIESLGLTGAKAVDFRSELNVLTSSKEGMLFPDTYLFPRDATPQMVVNKMTDTFEFKVNEEMRADLADSGYTLDEIVILASIIERETQTDTERPVVAGILLNRLNADWPLQTDATVQYFLGTARCAKVVADCDWWEPPLKEDLTLNSPFNTYKSLGLPPAPIASPGLSALNAAIYPEGSNYFYYLHDRDGNIHYARTLEEHTANVARYIN